MKAISDNKELLREAEKFNIKFQIDIHIFHQDEEKIDFAVKIYNQAYVLKITEYKKHSTRWYFTISGAFPKKLNEEAIQRMKFDACYNLGYFLR